MSFSYDLVSLKSYPCGDTNCCNDTICRGNKYCWKVIEKGTKHLQSSKRHITGFQPIQKARRTLKPIMKTLPCYKSSLLGDQDFDIYLKRENEAQPLQSVKARGVMYTLKKISKEYTNKGVITISTGNFAYILCYYGNMYNIPVTVVMPRTVSIDHVQKCRDTGSLVTVIIHDDDILEAHSYALRDARLRGLCYLDGNDHPHMIIGQTTLGWEILEEMKKVDAVILPTAIDNCLLTAGIAAAIKRKNPKIEIYEVKPTDCDPLVENIRSQTMSMEELTFPETYKWDSSQLSKQIMFDQNVRINREAISIAVKILHEKEEFFDYYTAIGLASILDGTLKARLKNKRVVIPVFGEMDLATDLSKLRSVLSGPSAVRPSVSGPSTSRE